MKRDLMGVGGEWRMRGETGLMMKKKGKKSTTGICASLTPDYMDKEESNRDTSCIPKRS